MPITASSPLGYDPDLTALLTVDVDTSLLEQGMGRARGVAARNMAIMERDTVRSSRRMGFAMQNVGFQVQDFVVQVGSGTSPMRAFTQQIGQAAQAFAILGGSIGAVAIPAAIILTLAGALAQAFLSGGDSAKKASADIDTLDEALKRLVTSSKDASKQALDLREKFAAATAQVREFLQAQAALDVGAAERGLTAQQGEFASLIDRFKTATDVAGTFGDLADEQRRDLDNLVDAFANLTIGANEFIEELEPFIQRAGPETAQLLREMRDAAIKGGASVLDLAQDLREAQARQAELKRFAEQGARIGPEEFGPPEPPRGGAGAIGGIDERSRQVDQLRDRIRALAVELQAVKLEPIDAEEAQQLRDMATAAETFGLSVEQVAVADPEIRELVQLYVELAAAIRQTTEANQEAAAAQEASLARTREMVAAFQEFEAERERTNKALERREAARVSAGGRLPDAIDAANIAAQELSTTLTDLDSLTFDGLLSALGAISQQIAQAIIQALIFRAIMAGLGFGAGGGFGATAAGGSGAGGTTLVGGIPQFARGGMFGGGRLLQAQRGIVFNRGSMALMTGAVSGAALLEGARDEAAVPLTRNAYGQLSVETTGGGGTTYNIDARGAVPGVEANIMNGLARTVHRIAPRATEDAEKRGLVRRHRRWG